MKHLWGKFMEWSKRQHNLYQANLCSAALLLGFCTWLRYHGFLAQSRAAKVIGGLGFSLCIAVLQIPVIVHLWPAAFRGAAHNPEEARKARNQAISQLTTAVLCIVFMLLLVVFGIFRP